MQTESHDIGRKPTAAPALPRRIALVNASSRADEKISRYLLEDLAEALPVYARLAGVASPELVRAAPGEKIDACDTVLLGHAPQDAATAQAIIATQLAPGARVYVLAHLCGGAGNETPPHFSQMEACCAEAGARWMGGLIVCEGNLVLSAANSPRMGWARRWVSEPLDCLIMAMLAGSPFDEPAARPTLAARITGAFAQTPR